MRIIGASKPMFLNFFVWGLKFEIQREILMHRPLTFPETKAKALLFEERNGDLVVGKDGKGIVQ